jgi:outer membrane protein OmpA-like peptidoglycan-associated protein/predicted ester cyclase
MDGQSRLAAPVTAFLAALAARDRDRVASTLADRVRLEAPPLGFSCTGRAEVLDTLGAVLVAFPDFSYRVRSRYVASDQVTDEALLEGTRLGPLPGSPPNGAAGTVPARVMMAHDGRVVTAVTLWVDGGALGELTELPDRLPVSSSSRVSQLRAALPAAQGRVIVAQERDLSAVEQVAPAPQSPVLPSPRTRVSTSGADLKVPVPRKVRRLQAAVLVTLMAGVSTTLVTWMVSGTVRSTADRMHPRASTGPATPGTPTPEPAVVEGPDAPVPLRFNPSRNEFEFSSDALFFDTGSFELTPQAQQALDKVVTRIRGERRYGRITVTGFTDQRGAEKYNLRLSRHRAEAVAEALRRALGNPTDRVAVVAMGRGEADPIVTKGKTSAELAPNRRVTIQVPEPGR